MKNDSQKIKQYEKRYKLKTLLQVLQEKYYIKNYYIQIIYHIHDNLVSITCIYVYINKKFIGKEKTTCFVWK